MIDKQMKVLVVDHLLNMRKILVSILRDLGFLNINEAVDGSTALKTLKEDRFDLVISAWNMPNMNGLELLKAIRSDDELTGLTFLMVTAEAKKENIIEAIKAGANNYILKPFSGEVFQKKLEETFKEDTRPPCQ